MGRMFLTLVGALVVLATTAAAKATFPETIPLPNGFQPEGISIGKGTTFYVGSIPTGAVYRGNLRTGAGRVLVPGAAGRAAIGIEFDRGRLFVAGGQTGKAFVYDATTGALVREVPTRRVHARACVLSRPHERGGADARGARPAVRAGRRAVDEMTWSCPAGTIMVLRGTPVADSDV